VIILSNFRVPRRLQKEALGVGILIALVLRGIFIAIGGAIVQTFTWVFYIFGAYLIYTAAKLLVDRESDDEYHENLFVRIFRKFLPLGDKFDEGKIRTVDAKTGKKIFTPMMLVFISLGFTDLMFAFDSIPAIFGLTKDPFIVFTTNIFALMGLQQLYFLLGGLIDKLYFLPLGLSIVLAFIGVKLILEALHGSGVPNIPEVGTVPSLMAILITISFTAIASVLKIKRDEAVKRRKEREYEEHKNMPEVDF
jgi:tellurite resistance protein TerC